jgi:hypothetical protein
MKEEKRLMLLQIKTGEAERNKLISLEKEAAELRNRVENLSDRGLATPRMQRKFTKDGMTRGHVSVVYSFDLFICDR